MLQLHVGEKEMHNVTISFWRKEMHNVTMSFWRKGDAYNFEEQVAELSPAVEISKKFGDQWRGRRGRTLVMRSQVPTPI